jgi:hypothetical protein
MKDIKFSYHIYFNEDRKCIAATTRYFGKVYKGVAKCSNSDKYDEDFGKKLATNRCLEKIYKSKLKYMRNILDKKREFTEKVNDNYRNYIDKVATTSLEYLEIKDELKEQLNIED